MEMNGGGGMRLDPGAQEFWPKTVQTLQNQFQLVHPQVYYPYPAAEMQVVPVYETYRQPLTEAAAAPSQALPCGGATRALLLSSVPGYVTEAQVRRELEAFGPLRAVEMERLPREGIVTVHFYDLRDAQVALAEIQQQHMRQQSRLGMHYSLLQMRNWRPSEDLVVPPPTGRGLVGGLAVWAQFAVQTMVGPDALNQGTIVVFNLHSEVSANDLKAIFEVYGPVRELRETPCKRNHRFIEFYDVRDAAQALSEMNGKEIFGKRLMIEFSRPGGQARRPFSSSSSFHPSSASKSFYSRGGASYATSQSPSPVPERAHHRSPERPPALPHSQYPTSKPSNRFEERSGRKCGRGYHHSGPTKQASRRSSKAHKKKVDNNFIFAEDSNSADTRTTVMIKNIPNKYSQKLFLNMLDNHCNHCNEQISEGDDEPLSSYDFVYLPIDFNNKCNVGYGFVNLTSPEAAWRLYKSFHNQPWEVFNSRKICEVTYARLQGLETLKEHFKNSKFACDTDEYLPVVFSPPRDGRLLTEPAPVVCCSGGSGVVKIMARTESRGSSAGGETSTTVTRGEDEERESDEEAEEMRSRLSEVEFMASSSCSLSTETQEQDPQQQHLALSCGHIS